MLSDDTRLHDIITRRIVLLILCGAYCLLLNWSYAATIVPYHEYQGFRYRDFAVGTTIVAGCMAVLPALWLPISLRYPSEVAYWMLYLTVIAPMMFMPYHVLDGSLRAILPLPVSLLLSFGFLRLAYLVRPISPPHVRVNHRTIYLGLVVAAVVGTAMIVSLSGFRFNLSFDDVYDRRMLARETVPMASGTAYVIASLKGAVAPLLVVIGIVRKRYFLLGVGVSSCLCDFAFAGHKSSFFSPLFLLAVFVLIRFRKESFGPSLLVAACGFVAVSILEHALSGGHLLSNFGVRRAILAPSLLTSYYWEFFSSNPHTYYSSGFLRWFTEPTYAASTPRLIGHVYFGSWDMNANVNIWGSAFANFGYTGMFVITFIFGVLLRVLDSLAQRGIFMIVAMMCGLFSIVWSNGALESSMLTNGVALSMLVFFLLQSPKDAGSHRLGGAIPRAHSLKMGQRTKPLSTTKRNND